MKLQELNKTLDDVFSTVEFEEDGGIHITGADWFEDHLNLEFAVKTGTNEPNQLWEAEVKGVREELLNSVWAEKLQLLDEHPKLWKYDRMQTELYFSQATDRPFELLAEIIDTHNKFTRSNYAFTEFLNTGKLTPAELCKASNALFAKGPKNILSEYAKVLDNFGMKSNIFGETNPKRWDGQHWVDETEILNILIIGESYVIAEEFDFNRV